MKKSIAYLSTVAAILFAGCTSTKNVITEYDVTGKITKVTETSESVVKSVIDSTKDKSIIMYDNSWTAYISASTATVEDPTPTVKMGVGKADKGIISLRKEHGIAKVPEIIQAARAGEISVSASGAGGKSGGAEAEKK